MIAALIAAAAVAAAPAPKLSGTISTEGSSPSLYSVYKGTNTLESWAPAKPGPIMIIGAGMKTLLTFTPDGRIIAGPGLSKDEATQQAVEALQHAYRRQFEAMARSTCRVELLYERCPQGSKCTYTEEPWVPKSPD